MFPIQTVKKCENEHVIIKNIDRGCFGNVYILKNKVTQTNVAGKFISLTKKSHEERVRKEIAIIASLHHENIIEYLSSYCSPMGYVILTKYYSGKTLCDRRLKENFEERDIILYVSQICNALNYVHTNNIIHRDIKPTNVVFETEDAKHVRIIDFGLSCKLDDEDINNICGTRMYLAPEVMRSKAITGAVDMWSLGVMIYWLFTLLYPFPAPTNIIEGGQYTYNVQLLEVFSDKARNFIENLLIPQPELRLTASSALQHSWLTLTFNNDNDPSSKPKDQRAAAGSSGEVTNQSGNPSLDLCLLRYSNVTVD